MIPVVLVYAGLLAGFAGLATCLRALLRRRHPRAAWALIAGGAGVVLLAVALPARTRTVAAPASALDEMVPAWQFEERHARRIHASPDRVARALDEVTAREITGFRLLTWIRSPRLPGSREPASILAAPPDEPILALALRTGFEQLARRDDETVIGMLVIVPAAARPRSRADLAAWREAWTPARFAALAEPGYAKAAMNFRWRPDGEGWTRLETETRIYATDAGARRRFAAYWRVIYPGSSLIRHAWLAAIARRAEAS